MRQQPAALHFRCSGVRVMAACGAATVDVVDHLQAWLSQHHRELVSKPTPTILDSINRPLSVIELIARPGITITVDKRPAAIVQ